MNPEPMNSEIKLIYGDQIQEMVSRLVSEDGSLDALRPDATVVIKPNLVVSRREWKGVDTDPRVVEAIVVELKKRGVSRIIVGDGSGTGHSATKAFQICGYGQMAKQYGLKLVDLERDRFIKKPVAVDGPFEHLEIARTVLDCDFLINVPVTKAHSETLITCSLKNFKGVMPRAMKTKFHGVDLSKAISQLAGVLQPDLVIVDGIRGDLTSETGRSPVVMNRMLIGKNPVEVDSVVADMLGYAPVSIRHITLSTDAGLGTCDLQRIKTHAVNQPADKKLISPPPHYTRRFQCRIDAEGACCTCMGNLIFALERLNEKGMLGKAQHFLVGQKVKVPPVDKAMTIAVGKCAAEITNADILIDKCPPSAGTIYRRIAAFSPL